MFGVVAGSPVGASDQSPDSAVVVRSRAIPIAKETHPPEVVPARKKWRQVANYIPEPPTEATDPPSVSKNLTSNKKPDKTCIFCPGVCVCRKYLTAEEWHSRT